MRITCGWVTDDGLRATKNIYTACIVFYWDVFLVFRLSVLYLGDEMTTSHLGFFKMKITTKLTFYNLEK